MLRPEVRRISKTRICIVRPPLSHLTPSGESRGFRSVSGISKRQSSGNFELMEKCDCEIVKPMPGGMDICLEEGCSRYVFVLRGALACFWMGLVVKVKVAVILF